MKSVEIKMPKFLAPLTNTVVLLSARFMVRLTYVLPQWFYYYSPFSVLKYKLCSIPVYLKTDYKISVIEESVLNKLSLMSGKDPDIFKHRLDRGDVGFYAIDPLGRFAGYKWLEFTSVHYEEQYKYNIKLSTRSAWTYDHYVHSDFRKMGVWKILTEFECRYAMQHGIDSIFCSVGQLNMASMQAQQSFGFCKICNLAYLHLLGFDFILSYENPSNVRKLGE